MLEACKQRPGTSPKILGMLFSVLAWYPIACMLPLSQWACDLLKTTCLSPFFLCLLMANITSVYHHAVFHMVLKVEIMPVGSYHQLI